MQEAAPADGWHEFLSDGLHLSPKGGEFVADVIVRCIGDAFPELAVRPCAHTGSYGNSGSSCDGIPTDGPWHDQIDYKNYAQAFSASDEPKTKKIKADS